MVKMNKQQKIEEVFKVAHLAAKKQPDHEFSAGWEARLMDDVRRTARLSQTTMSDESPLNVFAFRLGWAMLGLAFAVSAVFYTIGINALNKTESAGNSSLWELVDQSVNAYDVSLFDEKRKSKEGDVK